MLKGSLRWFVVLGLVLWTVPVLAQDATFRIGSEVTSAGDLVTIAVENTVELGAVQVVLAYDPAKVSFDLGSLGDTPRTTGWLVTGNATDGELRIAVLDLAGGAIAAGQGGIAQLMATVTERPATLSFSVSDAEETAAFDRDGNALAIATQPFTFPRVEITQAQEVTAAEGGVVSDADDTGAEVDVPAGALAQDTEITIGEVEDPPPIPPTLTGVSTTVQFGPPGTTFLVPVTLRIPYREEDIPQGMTADNLIVLVYNVDTGVWEEVPVVGVENGFLLVETTHFSYYRVAAPKNEPPEIVSARPDWDSITREICKDDEPWTVIFSVEAMDPNPGDVLTYTWRLGFASGKEPATEEVLEGVTNSSLTYMFGGVLQGETASYTISVVVSDPFGESVGRSWTVEVGCRVPVPIELSRFVAQPSAEGVMLSWVTSSETNNIGWNVYRSLTENGTYVKVNERLIPGAGTSSEMNVYEYLDRTAVRSSPYWYYLEQINLDGTRTPSFRISTATTDVAEETRRELPTAFALRNFPNPFNPATEIEYALPEERHVRLTVYNTLGQQVAVLVDGVRPAGVYRVTWRPEHAQSGVYVYRLDAGSFVQAKKMTYLR